MIGSCEETQGGFSPCEENTLVQPMSGPFIGPGGIRCQEVCMIRIKKILYPTDFSSYSNQAYFHAISLAEKHNASLTVLFVYNPDNTTTPGSQGDEVADRRYWQGQLEQIRPVDTGIPVTHVLLQ